MKRRDFVRGLLAIGVSAAVADRLAFVQGLGRVFPVGEARFVGVDFAPGPDASSLVIMDWQYDRLYACIMKLAPPPRAWFSLQER